METNYQGNRETREAINAAKEGGLGEQSTKRLGVAIAYAALNVAESLQGLHVQIMQTSEENRKAAEKENDKLIASNKTLSDSNVKYANRMVWLTAVLVGIGILQAIGALASSWPYIQHYLNAL